MKTDIFSLKEMSLLFRSDLAKLVEWDKEYSIDLDYDEC